MKIHKSRLPPQSHKQRRKESRNSEVGLKVYIQQAFFLLFVVSQTHSSWSGRGRWGEGDRIFHEWLSVGENSNKLLSSDQIQQLVSLLATIWESVIMSSPNWWNTFQFANSVLTFYLNLQFKTTFQLFYTYQISRKMSVPLILPFCLRPSNTTRAC